jgi:CDP-diacylglycerol---serine O-phosphatidyltransferase
LIMVLLPAALMISTIRFRSFKTFDLQTRKPYQALVIVAVAIAAVATHPRAVLVVLAYGYLMSAFIGQAITRFRHRGGRATATASGASASDTSSDRRAI